MVVVCEMFSGKLTPERQNILRAGLESLVREDPSLRQRPSGTAWSVPMETSILSEPANTSLILPKPLQVWKFSIYKLLKFRKMLLKYMVMHFSKSYIFTYEI